MANPSRSQAVAIVGMAGRFPGARDLDAFWRNVRDGVEALEVFTDADLEAARVDRELRAHPRYVRQGTVLEESGHFDAAFFGYSPREAQILDPQQRLFLECAWEAIEHAGYAGAVAGQSVGIYAGVGMNTYLVSQVLANPAFVAAAGGYQLMVGNDKDFLATRASYKLDLRGPSVTVQTACSTSLVAVAMACRALNRHECDTALAGGVACVFPERAGYLFEEGMILSPDGHCRPFDEQARGTRPGAGAGIVVLKRLADAVADRDTIHAVILGAAINNDGGAKAGYTAPSIEGQVEVIATAQALAGIEPRSIGYVEAHGTGTPLGDPIEIAALTQAFRASTQDVGFCRIGSLKANIGHLDAAAGVASLIKTVLVLKHGQLPPLVNFRKANPQLALDTSPFVASASSAPWPAAGGAPRRAAVSSFGIGGTNAHVVLEEAPAPAPSASVRGAHLLVLSARTPTALDRATADLAAHLGAHPDASLADVEWTLQAGRQVFQHRRAVVVRDGAQAREALAQPQRPPVLTGAHEGGARSVAFLFSGQGSQHAGMGAGLYRTERAYREAIDRCAGILQPHLDLDLREVLFGSEEDLRLGETRLTQPALFATEYALASLWMSWGLSPAAMLGHSIGEYVAAHLAGVMSLDDALAVVATRGRLMQAQPPGSMVSVHLPAADLQRLLDAGAGVEIAAVNAPGLCAVSGPAVAIAALAKRLEASGVEHRTLHTSHAFHSSMMEPVLAPFAALLEGIALAPPRIPYVSNLTGTWITAEQATSPSYYAQHLRQAVRFEAGVRTIAADAAMLLLEVGPGNALTSLARLCLGKDGPRRVVSTLSHPRERRPDAEAVLESAGRLWLGGVAFDWKALHAGEEVRRVPLPTYPFERLRHWVDPVPPAAAAAPGPRTSAEVGDWLYAPTWSREDSVIRAPRLEGTWFVMAMPGPLGEAVARQVAAAGATPIVVQPGERPERIDAGKARVRPGRDEDVAALVREVRDAGGRVAGAIHLWTVLPGATGGDPASLSYHALVAFAAALEAPFAGPPVRLIVATAGMESVLDERVGGLEGALALGPVLSLPAEVAGLQARVVDLDPRALGGEIDAVAQVVIEEAALVDGEPVVARRAGRRWVRRFERLPLPPAELSALPLRPRGVYLITGGLGGIGLTLARWLATSVSARLVLTARSPLPDRDRWDAWLADHGPEDRVAQAIRGIRDIEQAGGEVLVVAADAADQPAMRAALAQARARWGELHGVIHGAGITGNNRIAFLKEPGDVQAVFAPKVTGLSVLVELLGDTPLEFVALLSTINTIVGGAGLCDYASANAVLDAFVDSQARPVAWRQVVAVDYAAWQDVGMAARLQDGATAQRKTRDDFARRSIPPAAGVDAFARALASGRGRVAVVPFDLPFVMEKVRELASARAVPSEPPAPSRANGAGAPASGASDRPSLSTPYQAPSTEIEHAVARIWSELLGVEQIGVHDDFFELGGHSLLATRVLARVDQSLGVRLTLRDVFDAPTVKRLSEKVKARPGAGAPAAEPDGEREELEF